MKKSLINLGCPENKIIVRHIGIDLGGIKCAPREIDTDKEIRILVCGRFREKKGIPYAVEAFGIVKNKHPQLKLKLNILGDSCGCNLEEIEKRKIIEKIKKYNIQDNVEIFGLKPHSFFIKELYRNHIYLAPSVTACDGDTEGGLPVSLIEASASGMPVISTLHCDIPEAVINNLSGYLVPERDVNMLAEKLEFLVLNPGIWKQMGFEGRKHIEAHYDAEKQSILLEEIYGETIKNITY
jgi:colanic acid/amylovoran biosynthesis glycosyltransferase